MKLSDTQMLFALFLLTTLSGFTVASAQAAVDDGLVAYYPLDGNTNDGSALHNHMTAFGDATFGAGKVGTGGGSFDGAGDYFDVEGTNIFGGAPTAYSWQAWIKPQADVTGEDDYILATTDASNSNAGFAISARVDSSEQLDVFKSTSNANWWNNHNNPLSGASPASTDGWYHVATSWDGTNLDVYVNGSLDNGTEVATNSASESDIPAFVPDGLRIATDQNAPSRFFHGEIDEVAIWDRAITPTEISSLYNGGNGLALPVVPPEPPEPPVEGDVVWTMAVIPDTQNYVRNSTDEAVFDQMTQWIKDNRVSRNIGLVLHEGDIVNNNNNGSGNGSNLPSTQQWQHAQEAMFTLNDEVPYIMATGNHDHGTTNAQDRSTEFNSYFKATDNPLIDPAQGGILKGTWTPPPIGPPPRIVAAGTATDTNGPLQNAYYEYIAPDGRKLLVFSLEWGPRQGAVEWAESIADDPEYADHTAILLTHAYMYNDDTRYDWATKGSSQSWNPHSYGTGGDTNDGQELWDELVKLNGNFEMTFNGHVLGDGLGYLASTGAEGNTVHQMLFNTQFESNGGNGWIRLLEFMDDGQTVQVRTYSPFLDQWRTDPANQFTIQLTAVVPEPSSITLVGLALLPLLKRRGLGE